ncbi:hypothetical protein PSHT_15134 [Puccinia striiformis]|uniref:Isopropylmalate dehydrogenase-like domain-containing protein n=1 Tax=Puccinia striiformis TaxID=27350 RepID=A0A2S4UGZ6_9BASI|nr:hypothetical protein PSHT_15134 [Puccinia striiformis]
MCIFEIRPQREFFRQHPVYPSYRSSISRQAIEHFLKTGVSLPKETVERLRTDCDSALFGAVSSPSHKVEGYSSPIVRLRKELDLLPTFDRFTQSPRNSRSLSARAIRIISQRAANASAKWPPKSPQRMAVRSQMSETDRIWKDKPLVTIVHKSNVLSVSDGLFRESVRSVFEAQAHDPRYDQIKVDEGIVDSLIYNLYRTPQRFNVLVCPNLYGDIVSDAGAGPRWIIRTSPSVNAGDNFIMGEPVHGSAPDIVDHQPPIANPIAAIRSAALMLEYLGFTQPAATIYNAVNNVLLQAQTLPRSWWEKLN